MKKKKIIALSLSAAISAAIIPVSAESDISRTDALEQAISGDGIHILYNERNVNFTDVNPINNDGRIMIPFRAALEEMGANVDYDNSTRVVTAKKGTTTISFTLMDDTIFIDNAGEKSQITMDVPMIISADRTLVPIRFLSNAFGLQVGWDQESQTVIITDYEQFVNDIMETAPNIGNFISIDRSQFNSTYTDIKLSATSDDYVYDISSVVEGRKTDEAFAADINLQLSSPDFSINNSQSNIILSNERVYFKSDLIGQLGYDTAGYDGYYSVLSEESIEGISEDNGIEVAFAMAYLLDTAETINPLVSFIPSSSGSITSFNLNLGDFGELSINSNYSEDTKSEDTNISANISVYGINVSLEIANTSTVDDNIEAITIPSEYIDVSDTLTSMAEVEYIR